MKTEPWLVEVTLDYAKQEYSVGRVITYADAALHLPDKYIIATASDEIGAFNEAQKVLNRLGFRIGA